MSDTNEKSGDKVDIAGEDGKDVAIAGEQGAAPDLSTGVGVHDVDPADIPNILDTQPNLPPEVRAALVEDHPVTPGALPAESTQRANPMPVVTGTVDGSSRNDGPIKRYSSKAHPELVVWHPNGDNTIQFHNGEFATANPEWQAVLDRTPEVTFEREIPQGEAPDTDLVPVRAADVASA